MRSRRARDGEASCNGKRELAGSGRDAILAVILANPIAARHRDYYEGLSDEQLSALAERAAGMLVASMEGAR